MERDSVCEDKILIKLRVESSDIMGGDFVLPRSFLLSSSIDSRVTEVAEGANG